MDPHINVNAVDHISALFMGNDSGYKHVVNSNLCFLPGDYIHTHSRYVKQTSSIVSFTNAKNTMDVIRIRTHTHIYIYMFLFVEIFFINIYVYLIYTRNMIIHCIIYSILAAVYII